jgi:hypothetical protein
MKKILLLLTLALCACTSRFEKELGLSYSDFVVYYGAPDNETRVNGNRVSTWWGKRGIYTQKIVRVFDYQDKCISIRSE